MKKILFITSRNILSTCGELRLIKNRAKVLKDEYGYTTDYIAYRIKKKKINEDVGGKLTVLRDPLDRKKLLAMTMEAIRSGEYNCVILSGNTINLAPYIKKIDRDCIIILDIHGTVEEYVEFRNNTVFEKLVYGYLYKHTKKVERSVVPLADGILAVSHSLAEYYKKLSKKENIKPFVVPCSISGNISKKRYNEFRRQFREKYGLSKDEIVFVYSGGASPWQCINESVELFQKLRERIGDNCKMLLFSGSREILEKFKKTQGVITDALSPDEVMPTLCAGDFGIMLRGDYATNNYAFPNKFLEYVGSGLRIIATPYVYDVNQYINDYNLGFTVDLPLRDEDIKRVSEKIMEYFDVEYYYNRRDELIKKVSFKETLRAFDEYVGGKK